MLFLPKRGFYHPTAIIILALITLSFALIFFINTEYFLGKKQPTPNAQTSPNPSPKKSPADETANWKTYTNTKYKYSFRYPTDSAVANGAAQSSETPLDAKIDNTTYTILVGSAKENTFYLALNVMPSSRTLNDIQDELTKDKNNTSLNRIKIDEHEALKYNNFGTPSIKLINNGYEFEFLLTDEKRTNMILSTFQFLN